MTFVFFVFAISLFFLLWSGKILPKALSGIARILRLSEFITAFFLVAFATSVPELFVGISSVIQGIPSITLGTIMGSNLIALTLVIGTSVLFAGVIKGKGRISSQNFWLIFLVSLLPVLLATDGIISRGDGTLLLIAFGIYVMKIFHDRQYFHKEMNHIKDRGLSSIASVLKYFFQFLVAIAGLLISSFLLIWSSKIVIAEYFSQNFVLFGILFIALGTSLPELVFGIRMSLAGKPQAMLGNALGSVAFNATAIVGIVAVIKPISINFSANLFMVSAFLFLAFALFHLFVYTGHRISRREGIILLLVYGAFIAITIRNCTECLLG